MTETEAITDEVVRLLREETQYVIAGDWHVDTTWATLVLEALKNQGVQSRIILHVGDFGVYNNPKEQKYRRIINQRLAAQGRYLLVTLGNHEDYHLVNSFMEHPHIPGARVQQGHTRIVYLPRGYRWENHGRTYLSVGGANSINRFQLTPNVDWCEEEQISMGDVYRSVDGGEVDVLISHDTPAGVPIKTHEELTSNEWKRHEIEYSKKSGEALRAIANIVKPKLIVHGHYHRFTEHKLHLFTEANEPYPVTNVCLDMNKYAGNVITYDTLTQERVRLNIIKKERVRMNSHL